jgi:hypothetical protein
VLERQDSTAIMPEVLSRESDWELQGHSGTDAKLLDDISCFSRRAILASFANDELHAEAKPLRKRRKRKKPARNLECHSF